MKFFLIFIIIFYSACSHNQINNYDVSDESAYLDFFINETGIFLKKAEPPAKTTFVIFKNVNDKFLSLLIDNLRQLGYSIKEVDKSETQLAKNEFLLSFSIEYLTGEYIGLQLFLGSKVYSKTYLIDSSGLPQSIGFWSVYEKSI